MDYHCNWSDQCHKHPAHFPHLEHTHTCTYTHMHIHTHAHTRACAHTHMHARTYTHRHTDTHTHTHTHTHTQKKTHHKLKLSLLFVVAENSQYWYILIGKIPETTGQSQPYKVTAFTTFLPLPHFLPILASVLLPLALRTHSLFIPISPPCLY